MSRPCAPPGMKRFNTMFCCLLEVLIVLLTACLVSLGYFLDLFSVHLFGFLILWVLFRLATRSIVASYSCHTSDIALCRLDSFVLGASPAFLQEMQLLSGPLGIYKVKTVISRGPCLSLAGWCPPSGLLVWIGLSPMSTGCSFWSDCRPWWFVLGTTCLNVKRSSNSFKKGQMVKNEPW